MEEIRKNLCTQFMYEYIILYVYCTALYVYCMNTVYCILYTEHCILYNPWWISITSRLAKQSGGMIILTSSIFSQQWFPFMVLNYAMMFLATCNKYGGKADWKVRPVKTNIWEKHAKISITKNCFLTFCKTPPWLPLEWKQGKVCNWGHAMQLSNSWTRWTVEL